MFKKELKIRSLILDDVFVLSKILMTIQNRSNKEIIKLLSSESSKDTANLSEKEKKEKEIDTGVKLAEIVFKTCLFHAENDFKKWLGSLVNMNKRKVGKLTFTEMKEIINHIKQNEDILGFFGDAFASFKKMNASAKKLIKK